MSEVKVNKISPRSGTTVTLGDSGDTITLASGVSLTGVNATFSGDLTVDTSTLFVDSSTNRVGISNSSPISPLTVGAMQETGTDRASIAVKTISNSLAIGESAIHIEEQSGTEGYYMGVDSTGGLFFSNSGSATKTLYLGDDDNVGIGTSSPSTTLDVNGTITANRIIADTTTLVVDATNNRVGIGTASPDRELTVGSVANARIGILSSDNSTGASQLQFGDTDNSQVGRIYYEHSDDTMRFHTGNVERARISSSGFHIGGTGSANALDDYEEGTWTPTLQTNGTDFSSVGYANRIGSYTKIGRLVVAPFYVQLNALTVGSPSGNIVITGLPFTSLSNSASKASIVAYITNLNYGLPGFSASNDSINVGANVIHNTTTYQLTRTRNNNTADGVPYGALTSSSFAIVGTAIYDTN